MQYNLFQKLWRRVNLAGLMMIPPFKARERRPPVGNLNSFRGRRKAHEILDDETPVGADFTTLEYAIERKILEAPVLELSYYADVVGSVPADNAHHAPVTNDPFDIGNGDLPPEWGIDLVIRNGILRYGPWADRQRYECISYFVVRFFRFFIFQTVQNCSEHFSHLRIAMWPELLDLNQVIKGFGLQ
jgi:hypothetical protein